jgi:hypothetical protein
MDSSIVDVELKLNIYCNVDDNAFLGNDSVKQQWKRSDSCYAMIQHTCVKNWGEDVFCAVGAVVISRVWSQFQTVVTTEKSASLVRAIMKLEEKWMQWISNAARSMQTR